MYKQHRLLYSTLLYPIPKSRTTTSQHLPPHPIIYLSLLPNPAHQQPHPSIHPHTQTHTHTHTHTHNIPPPTIFTSTSPPNPTPPSQNKSTTSLTHSVTLLTSIHTYIHTSSLTYSTSTNQQSTNSLAPHIFQATTTTTITATKRRPKQPMLVATELTTCSQPAPFGRATVP